MFNPNLKTPVLSKRILLRGLNRYTPFPGNRYQPCAREAPKSNRPSQVVISDLYSAVVRRCNNIPASKGYPQTADCAFIQSRGLHSHGL
jgi:hypothetical protein